MEEGELPDEIGVDVNGSVLPEGEEYADDDEDDDPYPSDAELQPRALPVTMHVDEDVADDSTIPANSGEEYLRRVAREARRYPRVIVAATPVSQVSTSLPVEGTAQNMAALGSHAESQWMPVMQTERLAPADWCAKALQQFVTLRDKLSRAQQGIASLGNESAWRNRIHGPAAAPPALSDLLALSPAAMASLLQAQVRWLKRETSVTHTAGVWLYSVLALLDTPLDADTSASLRALLRFARSTLTTAQPPDSSGSVIASLHVLALIAARYYHQQAPDE